MIPNWINFFLSIIIFSSSNECSFFSINSIVNEKEPSFSKKEQRITNLFASFDNYIPLEQHVEENEKEDESINSVSFFDSQDEESIPAITSQTYIAATGGVLFTYSNPLLEYYRLRGGRTYSLGQMISADGKQSDITIDLSAYSTAHSFTIDIIENYRAGKWHQIPDDGIVGVYRLLQKMVEETSISNLAGFAGISSKIPYYIKVFSPSSGQFNIGEDKNQIVYGHCRHNLGSISGKFSDFDMPVLVDLQNFGPLDQFSVEYLVNDGDKVGMNTVIAALLLTSTETLVEEVAPVINPPKYDRSCKACAIL